MSWSRASQYNCINVMGKELKRRRMIPDGAAVDDLQLEVRRTSNYLTVFTLYIIGKDDLC